MIAWEPPIKAGALRVEYAELRREMAFCAARLFHAGLMTPLGGNISVRLPGARSLLITPSRMHKGNLPPETMVRVDENGNAIDGKPSVEVNLHLAIFRAAPQANAVIHTHSPLALAVSALGLPIEPTTLSIAEALPVSEVPPLPHGSPELAETVGVQASTARIIILQAHGIVAFGETLLEVEETLFQLEQAARITLLSHVLGVRPRSV